ncbi:MAG: VacJ family lipoprotein [Gammaproteobacteria bacterium]|nr:VacJ family lipoprotein [Gammaproteobacteria bacterium]
MICYRWFVFLLGCLYFTFSIAQPEPAFQAVSPFMLDSESSVSPAMESSELGSSALPVTDAKIVNDPYEKINRKIFSFNDTLDTYVFVPVAETYNKIMPKPLARGIHRFFNHLNLFPTVANDLLQGHVYQATSDSWRFFVNTTAGIGGFYDVATEIGLEPNSQDFGLTLASWGYTDSRYLVLPFLGPSTVRDACGLGVDTYFFNFYNYVDDTRTFYTLYALNIIDKRAYLLRYQDLYNQIALDRYTFVRDSYLNQRNNSIRRKHS